MATTSTPLTFGTTEEGNPIVTLAQQQDVFVLTMQAEPDNRFNASFVSAVNAALDHVEAYALPAQGKPRKCALVTASSSEKFYSNGLDVMWLFQTGDKYFISDQYLVLLKRVLTFPVITVAAIAGHCFAGGLLFALCHDYRIVRADRGLMSLNEIDLPSSLHPGMAAIARAKLPPTTLHPLVFGPKRYGGADAVAAGLADAAVPGEKVLATAHEWATKGAAKVARAGTIVADLKASCYPDVVDALGIRAEIDVREFMKPHM
ncbi:ClpP/crotonase-like domain-containing protein [Blastocladiella britannica]|nr:ClpP/crotonase-like domain-containing protein [Blastocladiella britannica]